MIIEKQDLGLVNEVGSANIRGMFLSRLKGKGLAEEHPEILDRYKKGETLTQLAQTYMSDFDISPSVGMNSVYYCLRYLAEKGEISLEDLEKIGKEHSIADIKEKGSQGGKTSHKLGKGCFGMSKEKRSEISRKTAYKMGKEFGKRNYARTLGAMSEEEKREAHRKSAITLGYVPFENVSKESRYGFMDEKSYAIMLKDSGKFSWKEIEEETNAVYGNNRTFGALRTNYNSNWRKEVINALRLKDGDFSKS